jgi:Fe2+ transport system protein B
MSNKSESNILSSVSSTINFIKERLAVDLKEASQRKMITVDNNELEKICRIAVLSIESNFNKGVNEVLSAIKEENISK